MIPAAPSFAHLLADRAQHEPDRVGYRFLSDPAGTLTYGQLHDRAAILGATLAERGRPGDRAVLLTPPGLDYIAAFFGCLYAGVIPVPAYPPMDSRQMPRLASVVANARPRFVLTLAAFVDMTRDSLRAFGIADLDVLAVDAPPAVEPLAGPVDRGRDDIAFLQYTSGSASDPKGVIVTHANLLDNSEAIRVRFGHDRDSCGVIWLPPYHDMGLIGGILQPLYAGFPVHLMSPLYILADPASWLRAVSDHRATTSGGPNFAFDLCVHKTTAEQREGLDLSSWSLAFCGAEPVRADSLRRFATTFAPYGFSADAFYPCYGLAESTLIAAGGVKGTGVRTHTGVVSCGPAIPGHTLAVRASDGTPVADGDEGEICVSGPSVSPGYWDSPGDADCFVTGPDGISTFRTGDLGFLVDDELHVTGRMSDLIIIRGRNLQAADVEMAVATCHPSVRPGCVAAFGLAADAGDQLAVVVELRAAPGSDAGDGIRAAVRTALAAAFGVVADHIVLVPRGTVRKTPSGKIRRAECRSRYLGATLPASPAAAPADASDASVAVAGGHARVAGR